MNLPSLVCTMLCRLCTLHLHAYLPDLYCALWCRTLGGRATGHNHERLIPVHEPAGAYSSSRAWQVSHLKDSHCTVSALASNLVAKNAELLSTCGSSTQRLRKSPQGLVSILHILPLISWHVQFCALINPCCLNHCQIMGISASSPLGATIRSHLYTPPSLAMWILLCFLLSGLCQSYSVSWGYMRWWAWYWSSFSFLTSYYSSSLYIQVWDLSFTNLCLFSFWFAEKLLPPVHQCSFMYKFRWQAW